MTKETWRKIDRFSQEKLKFCKNLSEYVLSILLDLVGQGFMSWLHIPVVGFTKINKKI